jgi:hypothetical protein
MAVQRQNATAVKSKNKRTRQNTARNEKVMQTRGIADAAVFRVDRRPLGECSLVLFFLGSISSVASSLPGAFTYRS